MPIWILLLEENTRQLAEARRVIESLEAERTRIALNALKEIQASESYVRSKA